MRPNPKPAPQLSEQEVALFCTAVGVAPKGMADAAADLIERYDLGRRGAWIMGMISSGLNSPSRLSDAFCIGRSLVTAELNRLVEAGLVETRKDAKDGRRLRLHLTEIGEVENERVQASVNALVNGKLSGYSREQVMLCAEVLFTLAGNQADTLQDNDPE